MTLQEEIALVKARIDAAHAERDSLRAAGLEEKFVEAYARVEVLERELERLRHEGLRATARGKRRES